MKVVVGNRKTGVIGEYIGRPSVLGCPFPLPSEKMRERTIDEYRKWLYEQIDNENEDVIRELWRLVDVLKANGELVLTCWCSPKRCHGDVIAELIEKMAEED